MNSKEKLLSDLKNQETVKRIKEIETYIDSNADIKALLAEKKRVSKEIVLAKKLGLKNTVKTYENEYNTIDLKIKTYPLVEEYMDLLESTHNDLEIMINYLESNINKIINE